MGTIITFIITFLYSCISYYLFLPAFTLRSFGFCIWLVSILAVFSLGFIVRDVKWQLNSVNLHAAERLLTYPARLLCLVTIGLFILILFIRFSSSSVFHSKVFAGRIEVEEGVFEEEVPTLSDIKKIPLMDTDSASILGDRVIGSLSEVVSQYNVSDTYTTIYYKDKVMKIAPLQYNGLFKYLTNRSAGIPGYILVNTETNEAEFVKLDTGIQYSPSALFSHDLKRMLRIKYPSRIFHEYSFQVDEEGNPFWVVSCRQLNTWFSAYEIEQVILVNAVTGETADYPLNQLPEWVDYALSGDTVMELYDAYGTLQNGFFNSLFSEKGCMMTTDDYGYVAMHNDIFVYTGVTSTASDSSNLGFLLVNTRTGDFRYYVMDGADEHSAMSAAEGLVQNYGYTASFPALINVNGEATYAMVLKDTSGLVKEYALVNTKNYTIVAVGDTMSEALKNYKSAMQSAGKGIDIKLDVEYVQQTITVTDIQYIVSDSDTIVYLKTEDKVYKQNFKDNESLILLEAGDTIRVNFDAEEKEKDIIEIESFEFQTE